MAETWASDDPFGGSGLDRPARPRWSSWWRRLVSVGRAHPAGLPSFTPTPVDKEAQRHWVMRHIDELPPQSVDEAHRHLLDAQIDDKADQWIAQVKKEFAHYVGWLRQLRVRENAAVVHRQHLQQVHDQRVAEALSARTAAADRLRGEDDEGKWHQPGHSDPTLVSVRSGVNRFYLAALVIAGAADFIAFYQVLQLVLRNLADQWLLVLVIGFTAIALTLAHYLGVFLRDRTAGARWHHPTMLPGCAVLWMALGLMAFWVRWKVSGESAGPVLPTVGTLPVLSHFNFQGTLPGASMFAAFYFATGAAAITGSYLVHNPLRRSYIKAVRAHEAAIKQQAAAARDLAAAEAECTAIDHLEHAAAEVRDSTIEELRKLAAELKKLARLQLAKKIADVSATDAFLAG
jgi:hypothetical protein